MLSRWIMQAQNISLHTSLFCSLPHSLPLCLLCFLCLSISLSFLLAVLFSHTQFHTKGPYSMPWIKCWILGKCSRLRLQDSRLLSLQSIEIGINKLALAFCAIVSCWVLSTQTIKHIDSKRIGCLSWRSRQATEEEILWSSNLIAKVVFQGWEVPQSWALWLGFHQWGHPRPLT